jgi:hypothetical protein
MCTYQEHLAKFESIDIHISRNIMVKYIRELGFGFCIAAYKPSLTADYQAKHLGWSKTKSAGYLNSRGLLSYKMCQDSLLPVELSEGSK